MDVDVIKSVSDSKLGIAIAKQLWPTMLFLVVCLIVSLIGALLFISKVESEVNTIIAMWVWIAGSFYIIGSGVFAFNKDVKIHIEERVNALQNTKAG